VNLIVAIDSQLSENERLNELAMSLGCEAELRIYDDPYELLSGVAAEPPDLLIANGHLSGMSASELLARFRTFPACSDVPAVILVAHESGCWREVSFKSGVTEYIIMPVDREELRLRSKHLLASRNAQKCGNFSISKNDAIERRSDKLPTPDQLSQIGMLNGLIETLSARLLTKITEVDRLWGELQNVVDATSVAAVFLDSGACVRHFTPQISYFYELSDLGIGNTLHDKPCKLGYSGLEADLYLARSTGSPVERYLQGNSAENYFLMRVLPNRSPDESIWGITITFAQVTVRSPGRA
jgi:DNA-binding response OmpR family regulator